jgi:hypothetical protein
VLAADLSFDEELVVLKLLVWRGKRLPAVTAACLLEEANPSYPISLSDDARAANGFRTRIVDCHNDILVAFFREITCEPDDK